MCAPQVFFFFYMLLVNVVLLNLLIAIMQSSHEKATAEAQLVALYRRANLVLEQAFTLLSLKSSLC